MKLRNEEMIKKHEALRLRAYMPTPNDVPTIGWGHTRGVKMGDVITEKQAQKFFEQDTAWAVKAVNNMVKVKLNQNQFDALVSWVFNVGETNARASTLVRQLNTGDYEAVRRELPRWNKQKGKVLRGLVKRRAEEVELFYSEAAHRGAERGATRPTARPPIPEWLKTLYGYLRGDFKNG